MAVAAATAPTPTPALRPQPQRDPGGAHDQSHAQRVIDDLETGHHAHLAIHGLQKFGHRALHIARLALSMREQLDGRDVRVGVRYAAGHHRARIGLGHGDGAQARHEVPGSGQINREPAQKRRQQPEIEIADDQRDGDEIDDDEDQDVREYHPRVANRERRLHELGRDPAGELIVIEAQTLSEHVAMEIPAQPHGEIAGESLLLEQALQGDQRRAAGEHGRQQQQMAALLGP